VDKKIFIK